MAGLTGSQVLIQQFYTIGHRLCDLEALHRLNLPTSYATLIAHLRL
jgi:histidinol phosphatase-like enzyme